MLRGTPLSPTLQEMPSQGETGGSWVGGGWGGGSPRAGHIEESWGTEDRTQERMQAAQERTTQAPRKKL